MKQTNEYIIDLIALEQGTHHYSFHLDDAFFGALDGREFQKGNIEVALDLYKTSASYSLDFTFVGNIVIQCDRCLDEMRQPIDTEGHLDVKLGLENADDEMVVIDENDGTIDLSWYMYEFIALDIPLRHIHPDGECNEQMIAQLSKHICYTIDEEEDDDSDSDNLASDSAEEEKEIDPRWSALKNIKIDN